MDKSSHYRSITSIMYFKNENPETKLNNNEISNSMPNSNSNSYDKCVEQRTIAINTSTYHCCDSCNENSDNR